MAKLFLRTTRKSGIAKLYTRVQRNGLNMIVCTGVSVNIKEWQKAAPPQIREIQELICDIKEEQHKIAQTVIQKP